ncbi:MAG: response regulator [Chromatiaceae bacterium]|nr:response regulator [Candidatus Thioaporhodococcus sediminis]
MNIASTPSLHEDDPANGGPAVDAATDGATAPPPALMYWPPQTFPHLLLIASQPTAYPFLREVLEGKAEIHAVTSAAQAMDLLTHLDVNLIILSPEVPTREREIVDTCRVLREFFAHLDLPILCLTTECHPRLAVRAFMAGCNDFINLPVHPAELRARIGQHLHLHFQSQARRQAEEQLRLSEERHRLIAESADDVIWTMGLDGQFTYVSPSVVKLRGFSVAEVMRQSWAEIFPPESLALVQARFHDFMDRLRRGEPLAAVHLELAQTCRDGSLVWTDVLASPLIGMDGQFKEILGVTRNIDDRKRAEANIQHLNDLLEQRVAERTAQLAAEIDERQRTEDQLRASERRFRELNDHLEREVAARTAEANAANAAKSEFLAQMSHEIRTPLNAILGLAQLLAREPLDERQRGMVHRIEGAGETLLFLLNDILDLARIEAGQLLIAPHPCDLAALLDKVQGLLEPLATAKGLRLRIDGSGGRHLGWVEVDGQRLEQILINLIGNAIKFTDQGQVRVRLHGRAREQAQVAVRFDIRDTGIGIAPASLAKLFTLFFQEGDHLNRRYGGSGLGLPISKRLVELMGGRIGVESQPGQGSTFWFELPLQRCDPPPVATLAAPPHRVSGLAGLRVLVVDDSEINREIIKQALEQDGVTVTLAGDGRQTLALLRQTPRAYDAVLMDVQMPDLDGLAATRSIRTELGLTDLPIIALTAGVLPAQRQQALAAGMNDVLTKPVRLEAMMAMIRRAVAAEGRAGPPAEAFPTIPGIDRELATEILCGNRALFLRLLGIFSAQSDGLVGRVRQELAQGDGKAAARRLHNLGGNAGSLGAMAIMALARQLETAIAAGESDLDAALAELDRQLHALCLATAPWLAPGDAPRAT